MMTSLEGNNSCDVDEIVVELSSETLGEPLNILSSCHNQVNLR